MGEKEVEAEEEAEEGGAGPGSWQTLPGHFLDTSYRQLWIVAARAGSR